MMPTSARTTLFAASVMKGLSAVPSPRRFEVVIRCAGCGRELNRASRPMTEFEARVLVSAAHRWPQLASADKCCAPLSDHEVIVIDAETRAEVAIEDRPCSL